jgi:hypothetical protein
MTSSLITLLYPLSIFCYALLEYPRPKKSYWTFCLVYTVILLGLKFLIHLQLFKYIKISDKYMNEYMTELYRKKIGFKTFESSFSTDFFKYILYDALVVIFILINDYLLVARGLWNRREEEIENIYQAMERIAKTKDMNITQLRDIRIFNNKYLESNNKTKMTKEERKTNKFSTLLLTDDFDNLQKSARTTKNKKNSLREIIKKSKLELAKEKTLDENESEKAKRDKKKKLIKKLEEESKKQEEKKKNFDAKYNESKRKYFEKLFPKIRNEKPGDEYYASFTISMLFIIIFVLIFYTTMVQDKTFGSVDLETKQFSGAMVIALIIHVGILVYDRIIYISQNRNNIKYEYILYDKETKIPLDEKGFNDIKTDISSKYPNMKRDTFIIPPEYANNLKEQYNIVYIQSEELNLPLVQKYILHILIVIVSHLFIFFYCPMKGNMNTYNLIYCPPKDELIEDDEERQCNDFLSNKALIIFYWLYIIYYVSSGLQVKYGYHDMRRKSMLKSGNNSINGTIYNSFKAIPFLYEIKLAIDWTFTKTCLDLFQWNKYESVYDIVYCTYCAMNAKNQQLVGQKIGKMLKILMGGALSFVLIFILVAPLLLFSSLNPTNQINNLTGATLKVDLSFVYKNKAVKNYTLFENSKPESIENIFRHGNDYNIYNYSSSPKTKNFPTDQIQTVQFFKDSDKNWDLARPHIEYLIDLIVNRKNNTDLEYIGLVIDYNFDRPLPVESLKINKRHSTTIYYYNNNTEEQNQKLDRIGNALSKCYNDSIIFNNIYSPPIRLSATVNPKRLTDEKYFPNLDIKIGFVGCRNETINEENDDEEKENDDKKKEKEKEVEFNEFRKNKILENTRERDYDDIILNYINQYNEKYDNTSTNVTKKPSYLESYFTVEKILRLNGEEQFEGMKFHVFSDQVSSTTSGQSILTFYLSFVLLVGTYVRNFFAGQPEKIMLTEMPHSEEIINLCEGIRVSRNSFDFEQEEKLYYILIELMRSPEYLRTLTHSSTEQFKQRQELTKAYKTSDDILN